MFFTAHALCSLSLFEFKTEGKAINLFYEKKI